jgi:hypothetical protein
LKYDYLQPDTSIRVSAGELEKPAQVAMLPFVGS